MTPAWTGLDWAAVVGVDLPWKQGQSEVELLKLILAAQVQNVGTCLSSFSSILIIFVAKEKVIINTKITNLTSSGGCLTSRGGRLAMTKCNEELEQRWLWGSSSEPVLKTQRGK